MVPARITGSRVRPCCARCAVWHPFPRSLRYTFRRSQRERLEQVRWARAHLLCFRAGFSAGQPVNTAPSWRIESPSRTSRGDAGSYGLDLFDLQFRRESMAGCSGSCSIARGPGRAGSRRLRSVTIDDCRRVSEDLSAILDVEPELVGGDRPGSTRWRCRRPGSIGRCGASWTIAASRAGWRRL